MQFRLAQLDRVRSIEDFAAEGMRGLVHVHGSDEEKVGWQPHIVRAGQRDLARWRFHGGE